MVSYVRNEKKVVYKLESDFMKPKLKPIESDHLWQRAYLELRTALADGRYHPGERVRLRDLAEELGTSVTPVREAVLQLVNDGALELRSPRDIRVRSISATTSGRACP